MALSLQNPSPGKMRKVVQFANAKGLTLEQALNHAGFTSGSSVAKRGGGLASAQWKAFFKKTKGGFGKKISSKSWGKAGSRGGSVSKSQIQKAFEVYGSRFGKKVGVAQRVKARLSKGLAYGVSGKPRRLHKSNQGEQGMMRERLASKFRAAFRKKNGGKSKGFVKTVAYKQLMSASPSEILALSKKHGVYSIVKMHEKGAARSAKLSANAQKLRASGKLHYSPGKSRKGSKSKGAKTRKGKGKKGNRAARASVGAKPRQRGAGGRFVSESSNWARKNSLAFMNGRRRGARRNGLALMNGLALQNGLALENSLALENGMVRDAAGSVSNFFMEKSVPIVIGGVMGVGSTFIYDRLDLANRAFDLVAKVPVAGSLVDENIRPFLSDYAPHTTQSSIGAAALVLLAIPAHQFLGSTASTVMTSAAAWGLITGVIRDLTALADSYDSDMSLASLEDELASLEDEQATLNGLALENMSALAGLALENSAYGDGFAYEVAPLRGSNGAYGAHDFEQATVADAYYAGADFSPEEGEALMNGRDHFLHRFGQPTRRQSSQVGQASHFAGKPGFQWGWLVKVLGYDGAARVCAMKPAQRMATIEQLKAAARNAYQQMMLNEAALQAESAGAPPEFAPAAGTAPMGAMGASGGASYLGDPFLVA